MEGLEMQGSFLLLSLFLSFPEPVVRILCRLYRTVWFTEFGTGWGHCRQQLFQKANINKISLSGIPSPHPVKCGFSI